jgi:cation diffusion facilitator family transporter
MDRSLRLWLVLVLNLALIAGLVVVGIVGHSLGVLAAGADYLADAAAIGVSIVAIRLASLPPTATRPHGFPLATTWAALVNAGWLLVLSVVIMGAGIHRLVRGVGEVHGLPVLVVSAIACVVMASAALVLWGDEDDDDDAGGNLNMRAVLLDTVADAGASGAVAIVGAVILATGGTYWLDPAVALVVSGVIAWHALRIVREATRRLRAGAPTAS